MFNLLSTCLLFLSRTFSHVWERTREIRARDKEKDSACKVQHWKIFTRFLPPPSLLLANVCLNERARTDWWQDECEWTPSLYQWHVLYRNLCYRQKRFTGKTINVVKHQTRSNTFKSLFQQPLPPPTPLQAPNHARGYKQRAEIICLVDISPYHTQAMKIAGSTPPSSYQKKK